MKETTESVRSNAQEGVPHEKGVLGLKVKKLCKDGSKDVPLIHLQHNEATEGGGGEGWRSLLASKDTLVRGEIDTVQINYNPARYLIKRKRITGL